nr:unnamed protein product [Digitaria exilis]CAB3451694.1 unnamed protein product [Digitaria exilis]
MVARRNPVMPKRRVVRVGGCRVQTTVTSRPAVVRRWLYVTLWLNRRRIHSGGLTVGMGVQWTPQFRLRRSRRLPAGAEPRPGTLQLCVGNRCLVFQIARAGGAGAPPQILRRFLADGRVTFAIYRVESDRRKLRAHHGMEVESAMELQGAGGLGNWSMKTMAEKLLGIRSGVEKPEAVMTSRWDGPTLSREQVRYAAVDAYISCRLGVQLRRWAAAAVARARRQVCLAEYYSCDDESEGGYNSENDDDAQSEASSEPDYYYRGGGGGGGWDDDRAGDDDQLYDSICSSVY